MSVKNQIKLTIIAMAVLLLSVPSYAESPYPNNVTIEITPSLRHVDTFKINGFSTAITDTASDDFKRQSDEGTEFSSIGLGMSGRVVAPAIRNSDRLILEFDYFRANDMSFTDTNTMVGGELFEIISINNGKQVDDISSSQPGEIISTVSVTHRSGSVAALYGFHLPDNILGHSNLQAEAGLQFIETQDKLAVDQKGLGTFANPTPFSYHYLDEKVTAKYFGPVVGVFGTVPLSDKLKFIGRARTGALLYRSTLDGEQRVLKGSGAVTDISASDHNSGIAYLGKLEAGISYSVTKWLSVDLNANITYLSKSPEIENPHVDAGDNVLSNTFSPVALRTRSSEDAGINFSFVFRR